MVVINAITPMMMPRIEAREMKLMNQLRRLARRYLSPIARESGWNMELLVVRYFAEAAGVDSCCALTCAANRNCLLAADGKVSGHQR